MGWRHRALILKAFANLPGGYRVYQLFQRHIGLHNKPEFLWSKVRVLAQMHDMLIKHGGALSNARVLELGTGWVPLAPVLLRALGVKEVHTYDINRHLLHAPTRKMIDWLCANSENLSSLFPESWSSCAFNHLRQSWTELRGDVHSFMATVGIIYHAPADASRTLHAQGVFDLHMSLSVFEHLETYTMVSLLNEARRLLRPDGFAIHMIDPTDHFALFDKSICTIYMLQHDPSKWADIAGHRLAYHNRLRACDFLRVFREAGFNIVEARSRIDPRALACIKSGFKVAPLFSHYTPEQLCECDVVICATPHCSYIIQ